MQLVVQGGGPLSTPRAWLDCRQTLCFRRQRGHPASREGERDRDAEYKHKPSCSGFCDTCPIVLRWLFVQARKKHKQPVQVLAVSRRACICSPLYAVSCTCPYLRPPYSRRSSAQLGWARSSGGVRKHRSRLPRRTFWLLRGLW